MPDKSDRLVFSGEVPTSTLSTMVSRGDLVRVATGIYVRAGHHPAHVVRSHYVALAARLVSNLVITDRSAPTVPPSAASSTWRVLYLARDGRRRDIDLPGLTIRVRPGAGTP